MKGWIYVIWCEATPDRCKIGFSLKHPSGRVQELQTTGVPGRLMLASSFLVDEPREKESALHSEFGEVRTTGEWFIISPEEATASIRERFSAGIHYEEIADEISLGSSHQDPIREDAERENRALEEKARLVLSELKPTFWLRATDQGDFLECSVTLESGRCYECNVPLDYETAKRTFSEKTYKQRARMRAEAEGLRKLLEKIRANQRLVDPEDLEIGILTGDCLDLD